MDLEWIDFSECVLGFRISGSLDQFFKGFQLMLFSKLEMDLEWTWNGSIFQNAFWALGLADH